MSDNIIKGKFKAEKPDEVWCCQNCDGQEWKLCSDGRIKCTTCSHKWLLPPDFLEAHNTWNVAE
jgi:hypothetical protein